MQFPEATYSTHEERVESLRVLQLIMKTTMNVLKHYEGCIRQFIIDGMSNLRNLKKMKKKK